MVSRSVRARLHRSMLPPAQPFILVTLLSGLAIASDQPPPVREGPAEPGITRGTLSSGGLARTWARFMPRKHDARKPCCLLVVLHGGFGQGESMSTLTEHGFEQCAERDDGIILYPDGVDGNWD